MSDLENKSAISTDVKLIIWQIANIVKYMEEGTLTPVEMEKAVCEKIKQANEKIETKEATLYQDITVSALCVHPFEKVISCGTHHNCTLCGKDI